MSVLEYFEYDSFAADGYGLSSLVFDDNQDLLWIGTQEGRVSSFHAIEREKDEVNEEDEEYHNQRPIRWHKYSSVLVAREEIQGMMVMEDKVLSVSKYVVGITSKGGRRLGSIGLPEAQADEAQPEISCFTGPTNKRKQISKILAGTNTAYCYLYDIITATEFGSRLCPPLNNIFTTSPSSCMESGGANGTVLIGGADGQCRVIDGRFRSNKVLQSFECHSGPVLDLAMHSETNLVFTCGLLNRPATGNFQSSYVPDPLVKAFDLRMNKMLAPISMSVSTPSFLKFIPTFGGSGKYSSGMCVLMASTGGLVQVSPLVISAAGAPSIANAQMLNIPRIDRRELLSGVAVASSGNVIAVGSNCGNVSIFATTEAFNSSVIPRINEVSQHVDILPSVPPPPPLSVNAATDPILGTSYILRSNFVDVPPSSFLSTPSLAHRKLELSSNRMLSEELVSKIQQHDFIGSLRNFGVLPNSLLYGANERRAFLIADPRMKTETGVEDNLAGDGAQSSSASQHALLHRSKVPSHLRRIMSHRGKHRKVSFDYKSVNSTTFVGLENACPSPFVNPLLQLLFTLDEIRNTALAAQVMPYHHNSQATLLCELGFLFHMMLGVAAAANEAEKHGRSSVDRVATALNFQSAFRQLPEAVALGLTEKNFCNGSQTSSSISYVGSSGTTAGSTASGAAASGSTGSNLDPQILLQTFHRFVLQQLQREMEASTGSGAGQESIRSSRPPKTTTASNSPAQTSSVAGPIDAVFGYSAATTTTFLISGTKEVANPHRALVLDLNYPALKKISKAGIKSLPDGAYSSFASVFYSSLSRETQMKGWCSASEKYERFRQVRAVLSLPPVLCIACGDTRRDAAEVTVAGALGEAQALGSMHEMFWSRSSLPLRPPTTNMVLPAPEIASTGTSSSQPTPQGCYWLPLEIEVLMYKGLESLSEPSSENVGQKSPSSSSAAKTLLVSTRGAYRVDEKASNSQVQSPTSSPVLTSQSTTTPPISSTTPDLSSASPGLTAIRSGENCELSSQWIIFDGTSELLSDVPASECLERLQPPNNTLSLLAQDWDVHKYSLYALISQISDADNQCVLHMQDTTNDDHSAESMVNNWLLFNDFLIQKTSAADVLSFSAYRHPINLFFRRQNSDMASSSTTMVHDVKSALDTWAKLPIPPSVYGLPSLSHEPSVRVSKLPSAGDLVAIDGEFVSVEAESATVNTTGQRVVSSEGRQALARISVVFGGSLHQDFSLDRHMDKLDVIADDFILPTEPVVDYVTRFSGVTPDDLDPALTRHALVPHRTAYLKLRYLVDAGCIFVGHGLQSDFDTANIFVPREQVRDTVELWRLPHQRRISLRFLAFYFLKKDIQDEVHDSIEDAKTAMLLFFHYMKTIAKGQDHYQATLRELYNYGNRTNWTLGLERL